jgi:hypothetical protein
MGIIDSTSHLSNDTIIYSKINDINEDRFTQKQIYKQFDYTLVLYWSSWRGRYSSQILKLEKEFVLNHPELRIQVIRVNMDFREEMKNTGLNKLQITADEIQQRNAHNNK